MGLFSGIFGTPNKDKAEEAQRNIEFNQLAKGNLLHNKETTSEQMKELAIRNYGKRISEGVFNKSIKTQGMAFRTAENVARLAATKGAVDEGGRSRRYKNNQSLMLLSQLSKAENLVRFTKGEGASALANNALLKYQADYSRANEMVGVGVGAKLGVRYTKDSPLKQAGKMALSIGSSTFGGLIEKSLFESLGTQWGLR
tara:strand:- start:3102 stop:3698 length:597 start_codon:yes stop_codon:yes gene_type:complete